MVTLHVGLGHLLLFSQYNMNILPHVMHCHAACGIVVGSNGSGQKFQGRQPLEVPRLTGGLQRPARQTLAEEVQGIGVVPHGHLL